MLTARYNVALAAIVMGAIVAADAAGAMTLNLPLSAVGQASSPDGDAFTVAAPSGNVVYTDYQPPSYAERRAIFEFSLAGLPSGATIVSADLTFNVASYVDAPPNTPFVQFYGYAGDNAADVSDATRDIGGLTLGGTHIDDFGAYTVSLYAAQIQSLVNAHAVAIGVLTYAQSEKQPVGIWTTAVGTSVAAPMLVLKYTGGTLAGDFNGDGRIDSADLAILDYGFSHHLTGYGNGDLNGDGTIDYDDLALFDRALANYVPSGASEPSTTVTVPEPTVVTCLVAGSFPLLGVRGRRRVG